VNGSEEFLLCTAERDVQQDVLLHQSYVVRTD